MERNKKVNDHDPHYKLPSDDEQSQIDDNEGNPKDHDPDYVHIIFSLSR